MERLIGEKGGARYRVPDFQKVIVTDRGTILKIEDVPIETLSKMFDLVKANVVEYAKEKQKVPITPEQSKDAEVSKGIGGNDKGKGK